MEITMTQTLRLPVATVNFLKRLARSESCNKGEDISHTDLIRRAIEQQFRAATIMDAEKAQAAMSMLDDDY